MSGFKFKFGIGFNSGKVIDLSLYKFTTWQPTTNIDGTREIVNEGSANNLTLYSGSGTSFNGTNQSVDGFVLPIDATHMIYLKDNVKVYTTTLIDFSTIVSVGTYKDVYYFNRALTTTEQDKYTSQPEQFYIDALADNTCVLNMPMNDKDSYARDVSNYSEGTEEKQFNTWTMYGNNTQVDNGDGTYTITVADHLSGGYMRINTILDDVYMLEVTELTYSETITNELLEIYAGSVRMQEPLSSLTKVFQAKSTSSTSVIYFKNLKVGSNVSIRVKVTELSGIYPKLNYTTDQNISNLQYGTQDLKLPHDDLGLRDGTITPWIKGDGVAYADTGYSSLYTEEKTIEYTIGENITASNDFKNILNADDSTSIYSRFNQSSSNNIGTNLNGYGYTSFIFSGYVHVSIVIYTNGYELYVNGISQGLKSTQGYSLDIENLTIGKVDAENFDSEIRLFKVHEKALTQEEVTTAYQDAVNKGLLA